MSSRCACCNVVLVNYAPEDTEEMPDLCPVCLSEVYQAIEDPDPLVEPEYPKALNFYRWWD